MTDCEKQCIKCKELKPLSSFYKLPHTSDGVNTICKECQKTRIRQRHADGLTPYQKLSPKEKKELSRRNKLKQKYNMTVEDYDLLFQSQNGRCAICARPPFFDKLVVDHCHETGKIRGLLCSLCNIGIGGMRDDLEIVLSAAGYLKRFQNEA